MNPQRRTIGSKRTRTFLSRLLVHPGVCEGDQPGLAEKRNLISSIFITMLIGLAYNEMFAPVRQSVRSSGLTLGTFVLVSVFFFTSMRFFIGNQLHLLSDALVRMRGDVWFYDFLVITIETSLLAFLGGVSSVEVSRALRVGFVELLIALYVVDVVWVISQWIIGRLFPSWRREFIPWAWALLNSALVICLLALRILARGVYSVPGLVLLGVMNGIAFVVDIVLVDYYNLI